MSDSVGGFLLTLINTVTEMDEEEGGNGHGSRDGEGVGEGGKTWKGEEGSFSL